LKVSTLLAEEDVTSLVIAGEKGFSAQNVYGGVKRTDGDGEESEESLARQIAKDLF